MSDQSQGPDWWLASDGKWYPPMPTQSVGQAVAPQTSGPIYEYKVVEIREGLVWGRIKSEELERVLNGYGRLGWDLKSMVKGQVPGRMGTTGVDGLLVTFQRRVG